MLSRARTASLIALAIATSLLTACEPTTGNGGTCRRAASSLHSVGQPPAAAGLEVGRPKPPKPPRQPKRVFNCTKQSSPQWNKLKPHKGSIRTNGKSGKLSRYYEWDHTHNDIEVYGPRPDYRHLGSMDPVTGNMYKGPVKGRTLQGRLK